MTDYEIASRIFLYGTGNYGVGYESLISPHINLGSSFSWTNTEEGYAFWNHLYDSRVEFRDSQLYHRFILKYHRQCYYKPFINLITYIREQSSTRYLKEEL